MAFAVLAVAALAAAQPASLAPARAQAQASITIISGAEIHFDRQANRAQYPLKRGAIRGEDGISRPALLVEFQ